MRALGNGLYEIENTSTGEKRVVTAVDLPKYGLSAPQQAQPVQQQQQIQPTQSKGLGAKLLEFLLPRTTRMGQDIRASGQVGDYIQQMTGKGSQVDIANQVAAAKKSGNQNLLNQLLAQSKQTSQQSIQAPQFSSDIDKSYLDRGVGVGAELGSMLAPFAAGKLGALSKIGPALNTGAKSGLAVGGILGLTKPGASAGERITGGATGAALGWGTGKILDKIMGIGKGGEKLRQSVVKPKVSKSDPFGAEKEVKIAKGLQDMGFKGSASQQREQVPGKMRELSDKITSYFKTKNPNVKTTDVIKKIDTSLDDLINFDDSIPAYQNAKDKFVNQLLTKTNKGKTGLNVSAQAIYESKKNLAKQLSSAFTKAAKGTPLTPQEEVGMQIWGVLDDLLPEGVKKFSRQQSILYQAMLGLGRSTTSQGIPVALPGMTGVRVGGEQVLQAKDLVGRGMVAGGSMLEKLGIKAETLAPLLQNVLKGERDLGQQPAYQQEQQQPQQIQSDNTQIQTDHGGSISQGFTKQQLAMAIISDPKNKSTYEAVYELMNPTETTSAAAQKRKVALDSAEGVYNLVEQLALEAPAGLEGSARALVGKVPGVEGGSAEDLARVTDGLAKAIAGALAGEVGVATDKDVERWKGLMPKVGDTMEERVRALNRLKMAITEGRSLMQVENNQ